MEGVIRKVIAGEAKKSDKLKLVEIAKSLKKKGAQCIILGCTELPLIFPKRFDIPVFDCLEILAGVLLKRHYQGGIGYNEKYETDSHRRSAYG